MRRCILITGLLSMIAGAPAAEASVITYDVVTTFHEPDTQPNDTIFTGSFTYRRRHAASIESARLPHRIHDGQAWAAVA